MSSEVMAHGSTPSSMDMSIHDSTNPAVHMHMASLRRLELSMMNPHTGLTDQGKTDVDVTIANTAGEYSRRVRQ